MKWQLLKNFGLNIFKKRTRSRTLWIGGSLSIFSVIALIVLLTGMEVTYTGDINCETECVSYFNVTSTYWRICFADDFELIQTNPDIPVDVYVPARGKGNWRLFDSTKDCIERKNKYRTLPNRFKIVGHKEAGQTVKWSVDKFDIDPKWIGEDESKLETIEECETIYWNDTGWNYSCVKVWHKVNNSFGNNCTLNHYPIPMNKTICKTILYKYDKDVFNASDWFCYDKLCGSRIDSDVNWIKKGKVHSGHSYIKLDTGFVKIDSKKGKEHYLIEKPKLEAIQIQ